MGGVRARTVQLPAAAGEAISLHKSTELFLLTLDYIRHNREALTNGEGFFRFVGTMRFSETKHSKEFLIRFV